MKHINEKKKPSKKRKTNPAAYFTQVYKNQAYLFLQSQDSCLFAHSPVSITQWCLDTTQYSSKRLRHGETVTAEVLFHTEAHNALLVLSKGSIIVSDRLLDLRQ